MQTEKEYVLPAQPTKVDLCETQLPPRRTRAHPIAPPGGAAERQRRFNASKRHRKATARAEREKGVNAWGLADVGFLPLAEDSEVIHLLTWNSAKRFNGGRGWRPVFERLPSKYQGVIAAFTEADYGNKSVAPDFSSPDYTCFWSKRVARGGGVMIAASTVFSSRLLRTQKLYTEGAPPGTPFLDCVAVALTRGSTTIVAIAVYIAAGAAVWAHAWDHINRLTSGIRAGLYGKEIARARIVIMGDLNAALGTDARPFVPGWSSLEQTPVAPDARGVDLGAQLLGNDLMVANNLCGPAAITFERMDAAGRYTASVLDLVLLQTDLISLVTSVDVIGCQSLPHSFDALVNTGDGHRLVQVRLEFPSGPEQRRAKPAQGQPPPLPRDAYASTTPMQRTRYRELLHAEYATINAEYMAANEERTDDGPDGARDMARMTDAMRRCASQAFTATGIAAVRAESYSRIMFKQVKACKRHLLSLLAVKDTAGASAACTALKRAKAELRRSLRQQTSRDQATVRSKMTNLRTVNPYASWQLLHRMVTRAPPRVPFPLLQHADGTWAANRKQNKEILARNFAASGRAPADEDPEYDVTAAAATAVRHRSIVRTLSAHASLGNLDQCITAEEVIRALRELPRHKARDADGFRAEHIADMLAGLPRDDPSLPGLPGITAWVRAFNHILDTSVVPVAWLRQVVIALHKGKDLPEEKATSYRPVCVTAHIQAVMDRVIVNRLQGFAAETGILQDEQYGFQPVRSCEHAVSILTMLVESRAMAGATSAERTTYACFLDVKAAFDSVSRERLTVALYDCGIRGRTLAYLRASGLMKYNRVVRMDGEPLDEGVWSDTRGVAQGVTTAPFAYAIMHADLVRALKLHVAGCGILLRDGSRTFSISFADDIVLIAESAAGLQRMLDAAFDDSRKNRYKFSATKCEVVIFHAAADEASIVRHGFHLGGVVLQLSAGFQYLGVRINGCLALRRDAHTTPDRQAMLEEKIHGPHGGINMVHASARLEALTALEHRQFIFGHVLGVLGYCSSFLARAPCPYGEDVQDEAARIAMGFPPRDVLARLERTALCGDLGLPSVESRLAGDTLRLFLRIHSVPKSAQLWRVFNTYRAACSQQADQRGNWCTWVRKILMDIGHPEYWLDGWPPVVPLGCTALERAAAVGAQQCAARSALRVWQQTEWRNAVASRGVLNPLYARLKRRCEFAEYGREGSKHYRRVMHKWRTEQIPAMVVFGRHAGAPRAARLCMRCTLHECEDVEHLLCRCPTYAAQRASLVAAVQATMPANVIAWAGSIADHPDRWVALWLDGELEGLPYAEAYGRDRRAIHGFRDFQRSKWQYMCVMRTRAQLRRAVSAILVAILDDRARRAGFKCA
jgi:hypothetical protein